MRRGGRRRVLILAALGVLATLCGGVAGASRDSLTGHVGRLGHVGHVGRGSAEQELSVPRERTARLQLARAQRAKQALVGTRGRERMNRRWAAARAYRVVREYFPDDTCAGSEGAFRAGELLRGGGDLAEALHEFRSARELCKLGAYRARAMLQIGHLERRLGHAREALDAYAALYAGRSELPGLSAEAMLWAGRVHQAQGRVEEASRLWWHIARTGEDPVDRVRAYDLLALALIERVDLEGAAGLLEQCRRAVYDIAQEETITGERVRMALSHMRTVGRLRHSVTRRRGTVRLEGQRDD